MKTLFLNSLLVLFFVSTPTFAESDDSPLEGEINALQQRYQTLKSLRARFTQTALRPNLMGNLEEFTQKGNLLVKKPGKLRWDYEQPRKRSFISDGKTLWNYDEEDKQVVISQWDPSALALQFLLGQGNLSRDFDAQPLSVQQKEKFAATTGDWVYLTPKEGKQESLGPIQALAIRIGEESHLIEKVWAVDPIGSRTRWEFEKIEMNPKISDKRFSFHIPKGVEVIQY